MRIVAARPEDAATLTRIAFAAKRHWGYPESWLRRWENQLTITPAYIAAHPTYVAADGDEIVGFCTVGLFPGEAVIDHLWVVPPAMNRGIGRSLFQYAEQFAKKSGVRRIKVEADPNAEGFYQRMGAKTVGREPADVDGHERFLPLMEKDFG